VARTPDGDSAKLLPQTPGVAKSKRKRRRLPHSDERRSKSAGGEPVLRLALHPNETTFVEYREQTVHKLELMRRYDGAYLGIIAQAGKNGKLDASRIFIIDAFSGAGSHLSIENPRSEIPGTAVQVCLEAREVQRRYPGTAVSVRLIDIDPDYCKRLEARVAEFCNLSLSHPERVDVSVRPSDFVGQIVPILADTRRPDRRRYCNLWFIDPFGAVKTIPKQALRPLITAGRGTEIVINFDAAGVRRVRRAIRSERTTEAVRLADEARLTGLFGDNTWDSPVPETWTPELECADVAEKYATSFKSQFAYCNLYPLRVSDGQIRYLIHLTHSPKARDAFEASYKATLSQKRALSMTDRDKRVEWLFRTFRGTNIKFDDMVGLPDCPLDRGQLATVLRRAEQTGHARFDKATDMLEWFTECRNPPALPLDQAVHTERKRARKVNERLTQPGLFDELPLWR
jgi:three-Cys-motif partner protein